jgi:hypothetical protein
MVEPHLGTGMPDSGKAALNQGEIAEGHIQDSLTKNKKSATGIHAKSLKTNVEGVCILFQVAMVETPASGRESLRASQ